MRIGIDATWAAVPGGTGSYTRGLVRALVREQEHELILYFRGQDQTSNPLFNLDQSNVKRRIVEGVGQPGRSLWSLAWACHRDHVDVFHSTGYFLPLWPGPKVATFHDANMFLQWDTWWRPGLRRSWLSLCGQTVLASRLAQTILTDSRHAAGQIKRLLRLPDRRVTVLYPGVDDSFFAPPSPDAAAALRQENDLDDYLLFVSVLSPQKNLEGTIRAVAGLDRPDLKLAIVGREDGPYYRRVIVPLIESLGLTARVKWLGAAPQSALPGLYGGARAFLFPSFAEGFGLPPLEAMACGTPVIASNCSSLPEVLGDAALLVDPTSTPDLVEAIQRVLGDVSFRTSLIDRGSERARQFRWSTAARRALEIYASIR